MIALLIVERPLCLPCISVRAGLSEPDVQSYLIRIRNSLKVYHEDSDRCRACGTIGKVYALDRLPI